MVAKYGSAISVWFNSIYDRAYTALVKESVPSGFRSIILVMRVTGIWPTASTDTSRYKWLFIGTFVFVAVLFPLSMFVNIIFAHSVEEAMDFSFASLSCCVTTYRSECFYWQHQHIRELFRIHERLARRLSHNRVDAVARMNTHIHFVLFIW